MRPEIRRSRRANRRRAIRYALGAAWDRAAGGCWAVRLRWSSPAALQARIDRAPRDDTRIGYVVALIGAGQRAGLYVDHL